MNIRDLRLKLGDTQSEFARRYGIPFRTIQNWEAGLRIPPNYVVDMLKRRVGEDLVNRKTIILPKYNSRKKDLPNRGDYIGAFSWIMALRECLGNEVVFALDEALMCQGNFGGHSDEYIVWVYGDDSLSRFNGVVILGNQISEYQVNNRNGVKFTNFNRTLSDAFANEDILDMQGTTEAVSKYYYSNGNSFGGISVAPEYQERFEKLASEAIEYYQG